jgi:hypothetical protein
VAIKLDQALQKLAAKHDLQEQQAASHSRKAPEGFSLLGAFLVQNTAIRTRRSAAGRLILDAPHSVPGTTLAIPAGCRGDAAVGKPTSPFPYGTEASHM